MDKMALIQRGSQTARDGFKIEHDVAERFNQWETDSEAQAWLRIMVDRLPICSNSKLTQPNFLISKNYIKENSCQT